MGVATVGSPLTMAMARRLVPFAERHKVSVAIHSQVDGNASGAIDGGSQARARVVPAFTLKLDVASLTASNCDAVADARARSRLSSVVLRVDCATAGPASPSAKEARQEG